MRLFRTLAAATFAAWARRLLATRPAPDPAPAADADPTARQLPPCVACGQSALIFENCGGIMIPWCADDLTRRLLGAVRLAARA